MPREVGWKCLKEGLRQAGEGRQRQDGQGHAVGEEGQGGLRPVGKEGLRHVG